MCTCEFDVPKATSKSTVDALDRGSVLGGLDLL